jgi:hypothetical protein
MLAAGHRRNMTDKGGKVYNIEHYIHGNHIELGIGPEFFGNGRPFHSPLL